MIVQTYNVGLHSRRHPIMHTRKHTHTRTHIHTHSLCFSLSLCVSHSLTRTHTRTHTRTRTRTRTHTHTHTHTHTQTHKHTHTHTHKHALTHTHTPTHTATVHILPPEERARLKALPRQWLLATCTQCVVGKFSATGATACVTCVAGIHYFDSGFTSWVCADYDAGKFSPFADAHSSAACLTRGKHALFSRQ